MIELRRKAPPPRAAESGLRNVYACLVHEAEECVVDLVRNLRCLDPQSVVLLYDGSGDGKLLEAVSCFDKLGARIHPSPRPIDAGSLHLFALDCMRFARQELPFDTMTIVDSDQLALRPGWSGLLSDCLNEESGENQKPIGLLASGFGGGDPEQQPASTRITPAIGAWQEVGLWRPLLDRFEDGARQFPRWATWPGTVVTHAAAWELVDWFDGDEMLRSILEQSRVWAKEQIIFPTLTALLGFRVIASPGSYAYVKHAVSYDPSDATAALDNPRAYWIHPVARRYDDPSRSAIRAKFAEYRSPTARTSVIKRSGVIKRAPVSVRGAAQISEELRQPILREMREVEGWLTPAEANLLIDATYSALTECPQASALVEVGSYCGRATTVLGGVVRAVRATARVWAIDPHDGFVGALDRGLERVGPTLERLRENIERAHLSPFVEIVQGRAEEVPWSEPLCMLLIDGLHDYPNVLKDFNHFESHLVDGALIAFHDYAEYFPGVPAFVDDLVASGRYEAIGRARSLIVLRKAPSELAQAG